MSENNSASDVKKLFKNQRKGAVRSLVLEFEQRKSNYNTNFDLDMLMMGAEQSSVIKSPGSTRSATVNSNSLVKQRVTQFDRKLDSDNQDKRKRHKSTTENNKNQNNLVRDFQRSKSVDVFHKEKDRYLRSRQISPGIKEKSTTQKSACDNDTNNNVEKKYKNKQTTQKKSMTISEETGTSESKTKINKSIQQEKVDYSPKKKTKIRSVKSIKKVFEKTKENSNSKKVSKIEEHDENISLDKKYFPGNDNLLSEPINNDAITTSPLNELQTSTEDCHCDNNKETSFNTSVNLEDYRKDILNNIAEDFYTEKPDSDSYYDCNDDDINQIESSLQEMEKTIREIKELHRNTYVRKQTDTENDSSNCEYSEEPENINVYLQKNNLCEEDDEFGQRSFGSFESINFTEAYNRVGDELIITSVAAVERRSLSETSTNIDVVTEEQSKFSVQGKFEEKPLSKVFPSSELIEQDQNEEEILDKENNFDEDNNLISKEHSNREFSTEELQQDYESETSNRSTMYSTAANSTESIDQYSKTESEEDSEHTKPNKEEVYEETRILENNVEIRKDSSNGFDRTIKTETIYDSYQNPRIAKVSSVGSEEHVNNMTTPADEVDNSEVAKSPTESKPKKDYLIEELTATEKKYITHLETVVWDYMPALADERLPPSLIGKSHYLFGNIKQIYIATQRFYRALRRCGNNHDEIAKTFLNHKHLFELYPLYSKNKPKADQYLLGDFKELVLAREKELNDRLGLASNLLTPIQRLGKYILFLEQIQKELLKQDGFASDNIYKAKEIVRKQMARGNDYIAIDSIKECPINLLEQGSFVMREKFNVIKPRKYEAMLFLFEKMLVFTTVDPKNPELFLYRDSIKLNEMGIVIFDNQPLVFHLKRFASYKKGPKEHHEFVIEAKKNKDKKTWTEQIEKRLWDQLVKCKEDQRELHNNQGKRNSVMELPDRTRKKKVGYSSLPSEMRKNPPKSIFYYKVDRDA